MDQELSYAPLSRYSFTPNKTYRTTLPEDFVVLMSRHYRTSNLYVKRMRNFSPPGGLANSVRHSICGRGADTYQLSEARPEAGFRRQREVVAVTRLEWSGTVGVGVGATVG